MESITGLHKSTTVATLKRKIIAAYLRQLRADILMWERILARNDWASDGSDYHKECRLTAEQNIASWKWQIRVLEQLKK